MTMTNAEREVLEAVRRLCKDGWPASVREIAMEANHSVQWSHRQLRLLIDMGAIVEHPRRPHGGFLPNPDFTE